MINKDKLVQLFFDKAEIPMFIKDTKGRFLWVNSAFGELFKTPVDQIIGKSDSDFSPKEFVDVYRKNDLKVIEKGNYIDFTEKVKSPDGERKYICHKFPISNIEGESKAVGGIAIEIKDGQ